MLDTKKLLRIRFDGVDICIEKRGRDKYPSMIHPNKNHGDIILKYLPSKHLLVFKTSVSKQGLLTYLNQYL